MSSKECGSNHKRIAFMRRLWFVDCANEAVSLIFLFYILGGKIQTNTTQRKPTQRQNGGELQAKNI